VLAVLFLSLGAGAVFEVAGEIGLLLRDETKVERSPIIIATGVLSGMGLLYVTGLLIK
jgi:hypothetical protein